MAERFVGLMSGTSLDGIDAVLVEFEDDRPRLIHALDHPLPPDLREELLALCAPGPDEIERLGRADRTLGETLAEAVMRLLGESGCRPGEVCAIGSHGQTVRHRPGAGFTLQIGDPNRIAQRTGITTVADFRRRDLAAGGQGAPLVPAFHAALFRDASRDRVVLNLGGMANLTLLPADPARPVTGFDTGPGNVLMDLWAQHHLGHPFDAGGAWAAAGRVDEELLERLLDDTYFRRPPPKSTGREHFNMAWLEERLGESDHSPADVQATLCELTAASVATAVRENLAGAGELLVCGGGAHNTHLLARLRARLAPVTVVTSDERGLPADWVEAVAFAWLARETLAGRPGNLPAVTGASEAVVLGAIHPA